MNQVDILLPFALPHAEMAADLLKAIKAPSLAMLVARAKTAHRQTLDAFSHLLPHELWLSRQFGLAGSPDSSPPIASAVLAASGVEPSSGTWFLLQPVHIHIARDHLVLTDMRGLVLSDAESRALFDSAKPLFDEVGKTLVYGNPHMWLVRADDWSQLLTSTPDAACGHNIDIWMPKGPAERDWRKLQNEMQMHWHAHPVNLEREARNLKPVNSGWLWGGDVAGTSKILSSYTHLFNLSGWMTAFGRSTRLNAAQLIAAAPERGLLVCDEVIESALAGDWSEWLSRFDALEEAWFSPLLAALKSGQLDQLKLVFTHNTGLSEFIVNRNSLRKFWHKPSLSALTP